VPHPPFSALAEVYDLIMADVDYDAWLEFILREAGRRGFPGRDVLELGCGTGNLAIPLAERGYRLTGIDRSPEMLAVARAKGPAIDWRLGEFESFALGRRFGLALSVFDSLNNLTTRERFLAAAGRVRAHLLPGGLFLFDVNTSLGLQDLWEGGLVEGWAGEVYYRWRHSYDPERKLARVEAFCDTGKRRFTEVHFERPFDTDEVQELLARAGFGEVETLAFPDGSAATAEAERIWVVARPA
jgi:SAM-dependent methyltransferase